MSNISMYICDLCNKQFKLKRDYDRHTSRKYKCNEHLIYKCECGYETINKTNFTRHANKKTPCKTITNVKNQFTEQLLKLEEKHDKEMQQLKQKIEKQKRPINYHFVVANFNNAINIEDCLSMENITKEIIDKCKKMPLKDGSTYILNTLCDIDPQIRPIHCTDTSRQNFLVKTNDIWNVDSKGGKIKDHLNPVLSNLYSGIYKEKMETKGMTVDEKLELFDAMSKELISENIEKCSTNAIKISSAKYAVKNIDNALLDETIDEI